MKSLWSLLVANALCIASFFAFAPVIGPIIRELNLEEWHSGVILGVAGVFWIIFAPFWGRKSDALGRRHILIIGTLGFAISYVLMGQFLGYALEKHLTMLVVLSSMVCLRSVMGIFFAAVQPVSAARIADDIPPEKRTGAMALLGAVNGVGMVVGPAIGGLVGGQSLVMSIYVASFMPFLACLILWRYLPKVTTRRPHTSSTLSVFDKRIRLPAICGFVATYTVITAQMLVGFYAMDRLELSPNVAASTAGMTLATVGVTLIVVQTLLSRFRHVDNLTWIRIGSLVASIGVFSVTLMSNTLLLMFSYGISAVGLGMLFPALQSLAANAVNADEQGAAAGSVSGAQGVAMVVAPLACTAMYEMSITLPFLIAASFLVTLCIATLAKKPILSS